MAAAPACWPLVLADLDLGPFIGVDLAPGMLAQAAAKQLYAELHEADIVEFLHADERSWPLILASDVLLLFRRARRAVRRRSRQRLAPGGLFVFSVELMQPDRAGRHARQRRLEPRPPGPLRAYASTT